MGIDSAAGTRQTAKRLNPVGEFLQFALQFWSKLVDSRHRGYLITHDCRLAVLESEFVVHGLAESLLAAEITFGGLNRCVSKQELNLLKFSTR